MNTELISFAHIASHDLQEPLRKIQIFSDRVVTLEGHKFSQQSRDYFERIQTSSERMRSLIEDLLAYSKTNNPAEARFETVDLEILLKEVVNELEVKIEEKGASIESTGLPKLSVIRFQLHQLLLNLLSNAVKFSKPGIAPRIVVKCDLLTPDLLPSSFPGMLQEYYHISVSDNGIGFEPEFSDRIFDIFYRLHVKKEFEGTGIGLAICKKIVENHNGFMIAEGQLNKGATFHVYLPAKSQDTAGVA